MIAKSKHNTIFKLYLALCYSSTPIYRFPTTQCRYTCSNITHHMRVGYFSATWQSPLIISGPRYIQIPPTNITFTKPMLRNILIYWKKRVPNPYNFTLKVKSIMLKWSQYILQRTTKHLQRIIQYNRLSSRT